MRETPGVSIELIPIGSVKREILKVLQAGISKAFHCPVFLGRRCPNLTPPSLKFTLILPDLHEGIPCSQLTGDDKLSPNLFVFHLHFVAYLRK